MIEATGSIVEITSDVAQVINAIHTQLGQSEPIVPALFKSAITELVASADSTLWEPQGGAIGMCVSIPNNNKEEK